MKADGFRWLGFFWKLLPKGLRVAVTRVTQDKFIVSVVAIVTNEDGKVLILDHVLRYTCDRGTWSVLNKQ